MGCTMGTISAQSYANIFMANFEQKYIYPFLKEMSMLYLRYISDVFMIWNGTKAELMTFIKELNEKHKTIKFDFQISPRKTPFLDTMLHKGENNNIQRTLYRKPTDEQALLHAKSEHPRSLKKSLPFGQTFKIKTICSKTIAYDKNCAIIKQKFLDRHYRKKF